MPEFREVTLQDKDLIERYLRESNFMSSEFCFANIFIWRNKFKTKIAECSGRLLVQSYHRNTYSYLYPAGKGDFKSALNAILDDAHKRGQAAYIYGIKEENIGKIEQACPGRFHFKSHRAFFDYIYETASLIELKGSKYHSKRNHINRFIAKYGEIVYQEVTPGNIDECRDAYQKWLGQKSQEERQGLREEAEAINDCIVHFEQMSLKGGIVRVNGELCSFAFGSRINTETFGVHAEKSLIECQGGYAVINREFAKHAAAEYRYINREEDLGIKGLRKAKMSYRPVILLQKYEAAPKTGEEDS